MRPDVLVGPSDWLVEQFGDKIADELWTRVPEALSTAIDREVLGFVASALMYDELHINNIAAHPDHQRVGIGRRLLDAVISEGRLRAAAFCVLEVRASNVAAQSLYDKIGFRATRRRKDYYRAPTEDAIEMVLKL